MNSPMMGFDFAKLKATDIKNELAALNTKLAPANAVIVATVDSTSGNVTNLELTTAQQLAARLALQTIS